MIHFLQADFTILFTVAFMEEEPLVLVVQAGTTVSIMAGITAGTMVSTAGTTDLITVLHQDLELLVATIVLQHGVMV